MYTEVEMIKMNKFSNEKGKQRSREERKYTTVDNSPCSEVKAQTDVFQWHLSSS